jgi:hypothetical protein
MIHENSPDNLRAEGEEMHAAFAADTSRTNQFEVSLIGQGGRLQGVAGPAPSQVPPGNSAQFGVNEGHQAAERLFISAAPSGNQPADAHFLSDGGSIYP